MKRKRIRGTKVLVLSFVLMFLQVFGVFMPVSAKEVTNGEEQQELTASGVADTMDSNLTTISSNQMTVIIDKNFPRVEKYQMASGEVMYGQESSLDSIKINGVNYKPQVDFLKLNDNQAEYTLNITDIDVVITIRMEVVDNKLLFDVTGILENGNTLVKNIEIPNHSLLAVHSNQEGAAFAGTRMYNAVSGSGDVFTSVENNVAVDNQPLNYMYAIINTNQLAGTIWTNALPDYSSDRDNERIKKQTVGKTGYYSTGIWSASWLYRPDKIDEVEPLPSVKVIITGNANDDDCVDWQDGAVAFREIMNNPKFSEKVPDLLIHRIPFNFASQATNPFLKTLDETKRLYLATDGLGQFVELKGYQSEGHDSAHPDYAGHIGIRQGGACDMNTLIDEGHKYNGFFGVHISATGAHPEAYAFDNELVNINKPGWDWLDPSYDFDKPTMRREATTNNRLNRFRELKEEVPNLDFIYADAWFENGWNGRRLAREINSLGWAMTTEFPNTLEEDSIWYHWAVDYNYGGHDMKGFNSKIARFIRNHQKDTWIARNELLGGAEVTDYEGWQGSKNFDNAIKVVFEVNVPTKYLQHFPIIEWESDTINFTDNVSVSNKTGTKIITKDGIKVLEGSKYLLPWDPATEEKLYHYNKDGGTSTWKLPISYEGLDTVKLYKLTDQGREFIEDIQVIQGQITINADPATPYVVYKQDVQVHENVNFGQGTFIKDPGFNNGDLDDYTVTGEGVSVKRNDSSQYELVIENGSGATISQEITGLSEGTYAASVYVEVKGNRRASICVMTSDGNDVSNYTDNSIANNYILADSKNNTKMQRMRVLFDVPSGSDSATIYLKTEAGTATVIFDDLRVVKTKRVAKGEDVYFAEDFENIVQGIYPFVKGSAGGVNDPRTHLSELHAPYTQKGWNQKEIDDVINGNWSLKAHKESTGLVYQTIPQNVRFAEGQCYEVTFVYETNADGAYEFVIGDGESQIYTKPIKFADEPTQFTKSFQASNSGDSFIGIKCVNGNSSDFVLDDLVIKEIEYLPSEPTEITPVDLSKVSQSNMTATATSQETWDPASNAIDGDKGTLWHTKWDLSDSLPQSITLNLNDTYRINKVEMQPRTSQYNGIISKYRLYVSNDGINYTKIAEGNWDVNYDAKTITFNETDAKYVKLEAMEGHGGWASVAELEVYRNEVSIVETAPIEVETKVGYAPTLPVELPTRLSDDSIMDLPIAWDGIARENYMKEGTFIVEGHVNGSEIIVTATVTVK
ncbi:endo-alpha-N-acetylgalactosaminidase family protein [Vallitalea guaymasensis]|uniref:endo-alpha-N-acetylgalactosaminidase family protein n=1 Tax=Vallitalea guaymasensis TaxID=1185412 RepID=UPI000DE4B50B|nr:endo-alpha-N-acetylgalactosaminidase family protein [Vallitalea guaymasensis]